jgi:hypothetical protein
MTIPEYPGVIPSIPHYGKCRVRWINFIGAPVPITIVTGDG